MPDTVGRTNKLVSTSYTSPLSEVHTTHTGWYVTTWRTLDNHMLSHLILKKEVNLVNEISKSVLILLRDMRKTEVSYLGDIKLLANCNKGFSEFHIRNSSVCSSCTSRVSLLWLQWCSSVCWFFHLYPCWILITNLTAMVYFAIVYLEKIGFLPSNVLSDRLLSGTWIHCKLWAVPKSTLISLQMSVFGQTQVSWQHHPLIKLFEYGMQLKYGFFNTFTYIVGC